MSSAKGLADGYSPYEVGTGRVDVAAAVARHGPRAPGRSSSATTPGRTSPSDVAVTKDLDLHQRRRPDVTLDLALTGTGGAFTLGDADGHRAGGRQGDRPGHRRPAGRRPSAGTPARSSAPTHATGTPVTRTSVALLKEDERYDLNIKLVDRDGKPGVRLGRRSTWPATSWPWASLRRRLDDPADAARDLLGRRRTSTSTARRPDRSGLAVLVDPETVLEHGRRRGARRAARHACCRPTAPQRTEDRQRKVDFSIVDTTRAWSSAARTPSRRCTTTSTSSPTDADDAGHVHAHHPLAQGRADARA